MRISKAHLANDRHHRDTLANAVDHRNVHWSQVVGSDEVEADVYAGVLKVGHGAIALL